MFCFIKKIHESKEGHLPSYLNKKHREHKVIGLSKSENAYISKTKKKNVCKTNKQVPKTIWIPKIKN